MQDLATCLIYDAGQFPMHCQASKVILPCKTALRLLSTPPNYAEYLPRLVSLGIRSGFASMPNLSRLMHQLLDNALVTDSLNCNLVERLNSHPSVIQCQVRHEPIENEQLPAISSRHCSHDSANLAAGFKVPSNFFSPCWSQNRVQFHLKPSMVKKLDVGGRGFDLIRCKNWPRIQATNALHGKPHGVWRRWPQSYVTDFPHHFFLGHETLLSQSRIE